MMPSENFSDGIMRQTALIQTNRNFNTNKAGIKPALSFAADTARSLHYAYIGL